MRKSSDSLILGVTKVTLLLSQDCVGQDSINSKTHQFSRFEISLPFSNWVK